MNIGDALGLYATILFLGTIITAVRATEVPPARQDMVFARGVLVSLTWPIALPVLAAIGAGRGLVWLIRNAFPGKSS